MNDTIQTTFPAQGNASRDVRHGFSPKHIIESLPDSATPAQQDSAIQAALPRRTTERSTRPDTLNLPGWHIPSADASCSARKVMYDKNFFSSTSLFHAETVIRPSGMYSAPQPYLLRDDDWITGILLCCFPLLMIVFSHSKKFVRQRIRDFFLNHMEKEKLFPMDTGNAAHHTVYLFLQDGLLGGLLFFDYTQATRDFFMLPFSPHVLLGVYAATCWAYLGIKQLLYLFVNWIFFDKEHRSAWLKSYSFLVSAEGVLFFPLALVAVFFNFPVRNVILCTLLLVGFIKLLLFYKTFCIFFKENHGFLHLIAYFCALEILPVCGLWRALTYTNDVLL